MPLTPRYSVGVESVTGPSSEKFESIIVVRVQCPHADFRHSVIECDGRLFKFRNETYRLDLQFPFEIDMEDEERFRAVRDKSQERSREKHPTLKAYLPRKKGSIGGQDGIMEMLGGELWETSLRIGTSIGGDTKQGPLIEEIEERSADELSNTSESSDDSDDSSEDGNDSRNYYGFKKKYHGLLDADFLEKNPEVFETMESLDEMDAEYRRLKRISVEDEQFDYLRYMGDKYGVLEDDVYTEAVTCSPFWCNEWKSWKERQTTSGGVDSVLIFEEKENASSSMIFNEDDQIMLFVMIDIVFAYCFEFRCTAGEITVESAINIARLSSSLSWLEQYDQPEDDIMTVLRNCCRRGVCYPYLRNWTLIRLILDDVGKVLCVGKSCFLKILKEVKSVFASTDYHEVLNRVFIDDFIEWIPTVENKLLKKISTAYQESLIRLDGHDLEFGLPSKDLIGFPISQLEAIVENSMTGMAGGLNANIPPDHCIEKGKTPKPMQVIPCPLSELMEEKNVV